MRISSGRFDDRNLAARRPRVDYLRGRCAAAAVALALASMGEAATRIPLGTLLRGWRERRRVRPFELALEGGGSARHLSFLETGRSRPSRQMVIRLAERLEVPL